MSWASQANEQENFLRREEQPPKVTPDQFSFKPMGGIGRGRGILKNSSVAAGSSPSSATNTTAAAMPSAPQPLNGTVQESWDHPTTTEQQQNGGVKAHPSEDDERPVSKEEESLLNKIVHDKLVQIKQSNIEIKNCSRNKNPNSPLFSVRSFEELRLRPELLQGVSAMGYSYPSKIQESTLPVLLADPPSNMIAQSQSGTGKTAAFVLSMLSRIDPALCAPQCLCLAPTYELALQIGKVVETMAKFCPDIKVTYAVRSYRVVSRGTQIKEHIIIGTPGTALDWVLKHRCFDPKNIRVFVLDEADVMISQQGHQDQSVRIHKALNEDCQRLFFSATYDDEVMSFAEKIVNETTLLGGVFLC